MITYFQKHHKSFLYRVSSAFIAFTFVFSSVIPPGYAQAGSGFTPAPILLDLPAPGAMVAPGPVFVPPLIKGLTIHPENPLEFDFIVEKGDNPLQGEEFNKESMKLVKYFLASLTVPEEQMWVNLSPHEKDRIISENLGATEMGKDMLAQDYILKQLTASLMYPEKELGQKFWDRVYKKAREQYGTTEIPVDTFNKVWIMPDKAVVYEHEGSVFVVESHLKVMLEQDYVASQHNLAETPASLFPDGKPEGKQQGLEEDYEAMQQETEDQRLKTKDFQSNTRESSVISPQSSVPSAIIKEVILPAIEQEVNEGKSFANLRQIYHSMILATWYKKNLRESLLGQVYVDKGKTRGVDLKDHGVNQKIYEQYLEAFKKGVYNYIKEDVDPLTQEIIPRKYFSGGAVGLKEFNLTTLYRLPQTQQAQIVSAFRKIGNSPDSRFSSLKIKLYEIAETIDISEEVMTEIAQDIENVTADEAQELFVGDTASSPATARVEEIKGLLQEIDKERQNPGSGNLPQVAVITDVHGGVELFFKYAADAISQNIGRPVILEDKKFPKVSIKKQLEDQGVNIEGITLKFDLLGDWADRGPYGVKGYLAGIELDESRLVLDGGMIQGNHDEWMENNLKGLHLPVRKGYNYRGNEEIRRLVEEAHWDDTEIVRDRFVWWAAKLKEYNASQKDLQKNGTLTIGGGQIKISDIRKKIKDEMYPKLKDRADVTADQKKLIEELMGVYFGADVFTGFNDIGMMPVEWWQERYERVRGYAQEAKETENGYEIDIGMELKRHVWGELEQYTKEAARKVRERFDQAIQDGQWEWAFFNDQNKWNYESPEWWAKDWLFHSVWGESVLKELNELEENGIVWDETNYMKNPYLQKIVSYKSTRYNLFQRDPYGFPSTHGWVPVDKKTAKMNFSYKGTKYEGDNVWDGLEAIERDRSNPDLSLQDVYEGIELVNDWYADKTTEIKPEHIAHNVNVLGLETIFRTNGIGHVWFTGHNPQNKLIAQGLSGFKSQQGDYVLITADKGMSYKKYNDLGGYVLVDAQGIRMRGFSGTDFKEIVDNPATLKLKKDDSGKYVIGKKWENEAIGREDFLNIAEKQLKEELTRLQSASSPIEEKTIDISKAQAMLRNMPDDYYERLGVGKTDDYDTIKKAYRNLVLLWHPDNYPHASKELQELVTKITQKLNDAWEILKNDEKRRQYDSSAPYRSVGFSPTTADNDSEFYGFDAADFGFMSLEEILRELNNADTWARVKAIDALSDIDLSEISQDNIKDVSALVNAIKHNDDWYTRRRGIEALGRIARDKTYVYSRMGVAVGAERTPKSIAAQAIIELLETDPHPSVRQMCIHELSWIADANSIRALIKNITQDDSSIRGTIEVNIVALANEEKTGEITVTLLDEALANNDRGSLLYRLIKDIREKIKPVFVKTRVDVNLREETLKRMLTDLSLSEQEESFVADGNWILNIPETVVILARDGNEDYLKEALALRQDLIEESPVFKAVSTEQLNPDGLPFAIGVYHPGGYSREWQDKQKEIIRQWLNTKIEQTKAMRSSRPVEKVQGEDATFASSPVSFRGISQKAGGKLFDMMPLTEEERSNIEVVAIETGRGVLHERQAFVVLWGERQLKVYLRPKTVRALEDAVKAGNSIENTVGEEFDRLGNETTDPNLVLDEVRMAGEGVDVSSSPASNEIRDTSDAPGGIDLNPALLDLQIKRDGNGVPLPLPMQPIEHMHIEGFLPIIINVTPITNLPLLLGIVDQESPADSADSGARPMELGFAVKKD